MFKKVIYNTAAQTIGKAITASSTLIITILIGKSLGPTGYGEFTKIFVFVGYFYTFADFGLNAIFVRETNTKREQLVFKTLIATRILISTCLALIAIIVSTTLPYNESLGIGFSPIAKTGIIIASLTIFTQALFTTSNAFFQKKLRYDLSTLAAITGTLVILSITFLNYLNKSSIHLFAASYVAGGVVFILCAYYLIYKKFNVIPIPRFNFLETKRLVVQALPIGLALIFNLIYFRIDVLILSFTRTTHEVGVYGLAYQFFEAALSIPIFFTNALYPLLNTMYQENKTKFEKEVKRWIYILLTVSTILTVFLIGISSLITSIFDQRFSGSQVSLAILSLGMPAFFISALLWHLLIIKNRQKYLALVYFATALLNITLNLILIPQFGFIAASATTVFCEVVVMLLLALLLKWPKVLPTLPSSA